MSLYKCDLCGEYESVSPRCTKCTSVKYEKIETYEYDIERILNEVFHQKMHPDTALWMIKLIHAKENTRKKFERIGEPLV